MKAPAIVMFLVVCCGLRVAAQATERGLSLSTTEDSFFKEEVFTGSSYVHFRTNGTYSRIAREHLFVEESDRGTWTQDSTGWITMKSTMHYRNIEAPPLAIWTWHTNVAVLLPRIHATISGLLRTNNSAHFTSEFVGERLVRLPSRGTNFYSPIAVDFEAKQISRSQLTSLLQAIETFTNRTDNHHFHVAPMKYKKITFLLWRDEETRLNRNLQEIRNSIDQLRMQEGKKEVLPLIYTSIDKETFSDEAGRTHEFIFHPEMNQPKKQMTEEQK
jgi:hypothetical protein